MAEWLHHSKCCSIGEPYRFAKRTSVVFRCRAWHTNVLLTATTVMKSSHMPLSVWFLGRLPREDVDARAICCSSFSGNYACPATRQRSKCFTISAPAWCDRGATLSEVSSQSKWMRRLWVAVQMARGVASTTRRRSLGLSRHSLARWAPKARSTIEWSTQADCGCISCQAVEPRNSRSSCKRMWRRGLLFVPMAGRTTMTGKIWLFARTLGA
jgi:hypothetical protein